jgi:dihydroneopterin aldolase
MEWIDIEDMDFYAFHGCYAEEQAIGNRFTVSLRLGYPAGKAAGSDDLGDALNYAQAYDIVQKEMELPSRLLEHVAKRILDALFARFGQLGYAQVKISKINPPLGGKVRCVSVTMERSAPK